MKRIILISVLAFSGMLLSAQENEALLPERLMNNITMRDG
jgi:hypothetical protein